MKTINQYRPFPAGAIIMTEKKQSIVRVSGNGDDDAEPGSNFADHYQKRAHRLNA
jgi:hypothetical protein